MYSPCFNRVSIVLYTDGINLKSSFAISMPLVRANACVAQFPFYGHENEMYNVGVSLKEVECL